MQAINKSLLDAFMQETEALRTHVNDVSQRIAVSNQQLFRNQQQQKQGMDAAEEHILILRRVLNDALGGTTAVITIERVVELGSEDVEQVQLIDWGWYADQLHYHESREAFMNGVIVPADKIAQAKSDEELRNRRQVLANITATALQKDEEAVRKAYDEGGLDEVLKPHMPAGLNWDDRMDELAPGVVEKIIRLWDEEKEKKFKQKILNALAELEKEEDLLRGALDNDDELDRYLQDTLGAEMATRRDDVEKIAEEWAAKQKARLEEMEKAKEELLEETKKFGASAKEVIDLINAGREDEARAMMAQLDAAVKAKEEEAKKHTPPIPDGASVFGG
jgi:hypothetical protein